MKNLRLIISVLISFMLFSCGTQKNTSKSERSQNVRVGAKAGVNISDITGDDVDSFNGRTSFHVGAIAEIPVSNDFSVQPELMYSSQGSDYSEEGGYDGKVKADYLNVPVIAKFYVAEGFSIEAGPQVGFLMSAKDEYDWAGDTGENDLKDYLKGIDFGLNFGLGYRLENGLNFGARYNLGLSDVNDSEDLDGGATYKNSVIQLSVGFFF